MVILAPSILTADFGNLARDVSRAQAGGAEWLHLDVMDGHFVPNLTFGPDLVRSLRRDSSMFFDAHLMISDFDKYAPEFAKAGADMIVMHIEAVPDALASVKAVHALGKKAGIAIKPKTPLPSDPELLSAIDMLLVMSVEPGFGGQGFDEGAIARLRQVAELKREHSYKFIIQVDGGVKTGNVRKIVEAGAECIVAGSAIFDGKRDPADNARDFLKAARGE